MKAGAIFPVFLYGQPEGASRLAGDRSIKVGGFEVSQESCTTHLIFLWAIQTGIIRMFLLYNHSSCM